jgi:uncharacterized protein YqeY
MLIERIKADALEARKARATDKAALLTTLFAEAARVGKDAGGRATTDVETVRVVRIFLKGIDDSLKVLTQPAALARARAERGLVECYLPVQLTGAALVTEIEAIVASLPDRTPRQMGVIMKALTTQFPGAFDGGEASTAAKAAMNVSKIFEG